MQAAALVLLVRRIGPRRIGRIALLAGQGYVAGPREAPMVISPRRLVQLLRAIAAAAARKRKGTR